MSHAASPSSLKSRLQQTKVRYKSVPTELWADLKGKLGKEEVGGGEMLFLGLGTVGTLLESALKRSIMRVIRHCY